MRKILAHSFFNQSALTVARELLGKYLVRKIGKKEIALMVTETEAYDGFRDKASHAHRGETARNHVMFGEAGVWYIYFTYGMHWMLNIVVGKKGYPAAVLIRGAFPVKNSRFWRFNLQKREKKINGPARLTKFLKVDKKLNNKMANRKTGFWLEDRGVKISPRMIKRSPRVGIRYAEEWADKPYRFVLENKA